MDSVSRVYFIGIKGTGMSALAELMHNRGIKVSGSDRDEVFYTDAILRELGIPFYESFEASHIEAGGLPDLVIYSAAYSFETNAEMSEAKRRGIPLRKYTDALGEYSAGFDSTGIAGVHGKTTTTALAGTLVRAAGLPAQILVGSAVSAFGGRSTLSLGGKYFVAETCEYQRHFLSFHPQRIVLTSVESDHQDYYPTYNDIRDAFMEYGRLLPAAGELIYCADDPGASEVALALRKENPGLALVPYGFNAEDDYRIETFEVRDERIVMRLSGFPGELKLRVPGRHTALNAAAAIALTASLVKKEFGSEGWNDERREKVRAALEEFRGSKRRSEILGEAGGILFMDDYGHHPTAIRSTLAGLREFYPERRLVLSFMSHTYTRTAALLDEFAASVDRADIVFLHKIYSSAREVYSGGVSGKTLFEKTRARLSGIPGRKENVFFVEEPLDGYDILKNILKAGDLFITMGAGDNWKLAEKLFASYREAEVTNTARSSVGRFLMKSMTGYAYSESTKEKTTIAVELKSYNNRFLDLSVHLPAWLSSLETRVREYLSSRIARGKVELSVRIREEDSSVSVSVNKSVAMKYKTAIDELAGALDIKEKPNLSMILSLEGVLESETQRDAEKYWALIEPVLAAAADRFDTERGREGDHTAQDILSHIAIMENSVRIINSHVPELEASIKENLRGRFAELLGDRIDENRVLAETAVLLMKYSISEELARLSSHLNEFRLEVERNPGPGKKLDFLSQEMNREVNTIGSKTPVLEVSRAVVEMKSALEDIREQLRNVE